VGVDIFDDLKRKSALVKWNKDKRREHFMLFSKSGFTDVLKDRARNEGTLLIAQ